MQNVLSSVSCAGDNNAVTITASNLFDTGNSASFSFFVNTFLSPPTLQPVDQLIITSSINGFDID